MDTVTLLKPSPMTTIPVGQALYPRILAQPGSPAPYTTSGKILDSEWGFLTGLNKRPDDTSQFGEATLLAAIFEKIGAVLPWCFECGASEPEHNSTTKLFRDQQWQSVLIEMDHGKANLLRSRGGPWAIVVEQEATDLDAILDGVGCPWCRTRFPYKAGFGVIDLDGQDWHLWKKMVVYRPRVMVVECWPYDDAAPVPKVGGKGQAGENAIVELGLEKGYKPICRTTCNVIFIDGR